MSAKEKGTLYGLGMGPGDPGLVTLKALEIVKRVPVVFAASSSKNTYSLALNTVRDHLRPEVEIHLLDFPMTKDREALHAAWEANAWAVLAVLESGRDAAFLTIGDPLTYSTYGYLLKTVLRLDPRAKVETVPGITAYQAAACKLSIPLVEGNESLMVVSGVSDPADIERLVDCADNLVIMKAYRNYDAIIDALENGRDKRCSYLVSRCGLPEETVHHDPASLKGSNMPYLSLVIAKRPPEEE